jgi:stearoyl-CoA desaturase (delta-9 desaturase)
VFTGIIHLSPTATFVVIICSIQLTVLISTLYLHRDQTHGAITFHPALRNFFRTWLWLTNFGVVTKQWVAVHRKHHAKCDTVDDPHSPVIHGIWKVLTQGTMLYRAAARDKEVVNLYGLGVKEGWMDHNIFNKRKFYGAPLFLLFEMTLFGASTGALVWIFQVTVLPLWASAFINGVAHYVGYRNADTRDSSRNYFPVGVLFGGEELHNNHHARPGSAKFSVKWWEFDNGWLVIRILAFFRLLKINRV